MNPEIFSQHPYRWKLDWALRGACQAAERGDILVIVDTLSFSTAVACAVHQGGIVYPCSKTEDTAAFAQRIGGEVAVNRRDVPQKGRFSLSPVTEKHGFQASQFIRELSKKFAEFQVPFFQGPANPCIQNPKSLHRVAR